jgi:predicted protein tyrosine phosphatase
MYMSRPDVSVLVMSKMMFNDVMQNRGITDETVESWGNSGYYFISINDLEIDPELGNTDFRSWFSRNHSNVLRLAFADVETEKPVIIEYKSKVKESGKQLLIVNPFTSVQAEEIFDFIGKMKRGKRPVTLVVHCHAGVSRSAAVGEFAVKYLGGDYEAFRKMHPNILPNTLVMKKLWGIAEADYIGNNYDSIVTGG